MVAISSFYSSNNNEDLSDSNNKENLIDKGWALYDQGSYGEAIQYYDKALAIDPNNVNAVNDKGNALNDLGKYEEAIHIMIKHWL